MHLSTLQQLLDHETNQLAGFEPDDATGLSQVLRQQLQDVRTRADDVANWPNVSIRRHQLSTAVSLNLYVSADHSHL